LGERAMLTIIPDPELTPSEVAARGSEFQPKGIGFAHVSKGKLGGSLPIPHDALPTLLSALAAGRINFPVMEGGPPSRSELLITLISFRSNFDPDDLPPDEPQARKPSPKPK
ncbi:hypothetical protein WDZ92_46495, partial [Nostoc sp. NIES-2111]